VAEPRVREFLSSPRIPAAERKEALRGALEGRVPDLFLRFVMLVVDKRRQRLLAEIAHEYRALVDEQAGRVRVQVAISHAPDQALRDEVANALAARLGKAVVASFTVDPGPAGRDGGALRRRDPGRQRPHRRRESPAPHGRRDDGEADGVTESAKCQVRLGTAPRLSTGHLALST
jgi:hypothetical protein